MRTLPLAAAAALALGALGCDCGGALPSANRDGSFSVDGSPAIAGLLDLRIEPADAIVETRDGVPEMLTYRAIGTFLSGERDVTSLVRFSLMGSIDVGTFSGDLVM